jgi:hypothetical protein
MKSIKCAVIISVIGSAITMDAMQPRIRTKNDIYGVKEDGCRVTENAPQPEEVPLPDVTVPDHLREELRAANTQPQEASQTQK